MSYLGNLTLHLTAGAMRLPEQDRWRHAAFLRDHQNHDGGFAGRQGTSDLYYTGFGLRGLALLGQLTDQAAQRAARFLQQRLARPFGGTSGCPTDGGMSSIDFLWLVHSAVLLQVASGIDVFAIAGRDRRAVVTGTIDRFRRDDGGYAKTDRSRHSSTYHTFLAVSCKQLVGARMDEPQRTIQMVRSRRRADGGFVETARLEQSATNPTAAAVGTLRLFDALDEPTRKGAVEFLQAMQNAEGGLRANTRIPLADLLSTFTGLVALVDLDALGAADLAAARRYAEALQRSEGGFRGAAWDDAADVEYTFYGLGTLALLAGQA